MKLHTMTAFTTVVWLMVSPVGQSQDYGLPPGVKPVPPGARASRPSVWPGESLAQALARELRECGELSRYRVDVSNQEGVIDLRGEVTDEAQRAVVVRIARAMPGVAMVRDWLQVRGESGVITAQGPVFPPPPREEKSGKGQERIDGQLQDPMPIFQAPPGPIPSMQPPPLPPYAWPTFAPYNNYSRVAYPNAYPYEQWPFIGPMYPFPRVPLGWRSVSLTWEDGHWWYNRNPTGHDWWRVRYW